MKKHEERHLFFKRVAEARALNSLTQQELADIVGVSQRQIAAYEAADSFPRKGILIKLATALGTTPEWLTTGEGESRIKARISPADVSYKVPILQSEQIIDWLVTIGDTVGLVKFHNTSHKLSSTAFAMHINDEAMSASTPDGYGFPKGALVIFEPAIEAKNQDFVLAILDNDFKNAIFRRYFPGLMTTTLTPLDSRYPQEQFENKDIEDGKLSLIPAVYVEITLPALSRT
ncbi:helix-turn-helix domain-containing protein [Leminorella grimontii]|nr:LexA family transcriptional regulator [Leminorella grimontii]